MNAQDVMKMIQENEVRFVDLRFTDIRGKEHHVGLPVSAFEEEHFEHGHPFDGSSLAGWKGIQASDMILMPEPSTAYIDPFFDETTLVITCDVIEPSDGKGYDRDPRSIAKRAEAYLKSTGIGDTAFFGPEPEFFIFDSVECRSTCRACIARSSRKRPPGRPRTSSKAATPATVRASRAATSRFRRSTASTTCAPPWCSRSRPAACRSRCTTTKWPTPASARSAPSSAR